MTCLFVPLISLQSSHSASVTSHRHPAPYWISREVEPQQNGSAITCDAKNRVTEFAIAVQIAMQSLNKETYLDQDVPKTKLPASVDSISILNEQGKVTDSTLSNFQSTVGIRWILIKTKAPYLSGPNKRASYVGLVDEPLKRSR